VRILVVEDDLATRKGLEEILRDSGAEVKSVGTLAEGRTALARFDPELCVADLLLPDGDGIEFLRAARSEDALREVVVLTGHGSVDSAVEAMKAGAFDYLLKPLTAAQIELVLERLSQRRDLEREVEDLRSQLARTGRFGALVGKSAAMQEIFRVISRVAKSDAPVMVVGESGTGKEVVAATIHELSRRRAKPFVAINCGAVSPTLIESELFGHEKGAFTGADRRRSGYFEMANGGTLFLDEVTEMSAELQIKLLRVLETRAFRRVGGNQEIHVDVRVISSSNRDPGDAIQSGKLREDVFYRLNVFPLVLPPLRERKDDVSLLAEHFLEQIEAKERSGIRGFDAKATDALLAHDWPGNVRELRNAVHRAYVLSDPPVIGPKAVQSVLGNVPKVVRPGVGGQPVVQVTVGESLAEVERRLLQKTLEFAKGNKRKAAELLKISLKTIYNKMKQYGIEH
jgi:two-component system, NtrC family, response regulator HydG